MKNLKSIATQVIHAYHEYIEKGNRELFLFSASYYMKEYVLHQFQDEDIASEQYIHSQDKIVYLLEKYEKGSQKNLIGFLNACARNQVRNLKKKQYREPVALSNYSYYLSIEESSQKIDYSPWEEKFATIFSTLLFPFNIALALKYDLMNYGNWTLELKKHLLEKGIAYSAVEEDHLAKRLNFGRKREMLLSQINNLTFKLVNDSNISSRNIWKEKKDLKLKQINNLLIRGLYSNQELGDLFCINKEKIRRNFQDFVKRSEESQNPARFTKKSQAA